MGQDPNGRSDPTGIRRGPPPRPASAPARGAGPAEGSGCERSNSDLAGQPKRPDPPDPTDRTRPTETGPVPHPAGFARPPRPRPKATPHRPCLADRTSPPSTNASPWPWDLVADRAAAPPRAARSAPGSTGQPGAGEPGAEPPRARERDAMASFRFPPRSSHRAPFAAPGERQAVPRKPVRPLPRRCRACAAPVPHRCPAQRGAVGGAAPEIQRFLPGTQSTSARPS